MGKFNIKRNGQRFFIYYEVTAYGACEAAIYPAKAPFGFLDNCCLNMRKVGERRFECWNISEEELAKQMKEWAYIQARLYQEKNVREAEEEKERKKYIKTLDKLLTM